MPLGELHVWTVVWPFDSVYLIYPLFVVDRIYIGISEIELGNHVSQADRPHGLVFLVHNENSVHSFLGCCLHDLLQSVVISHRNWSKVRLMGAEKSSPLVSHCKEISKGFSEGPEESHQVGEPGVLHLSVD